ncbi:hypothetical protein M8818_000987 [Zalaria obscura]|uniref:Uncharacterized protein n=1 Tax=Zalaria obscura TaxID=2024903 RepID=A0ACC3SLI8_9PEZI
MLWTPTWTLTRPLTIAPEVDMPTVIAGRGLQVPETFPIPPACSWRLRLKGPVSVGMHCALCATEDVSRREVVCQTQIASVIGFPVACYRSTACLRSNDHVKLTKQADCASWEAVPWKLAPIAPAW